ncbi:MAG: ABC transporter permease [Spirochaetia bacterium]|nr:ABC transporter permease [Spirochaetia bacterium]
MKSENLTVNASVKEWDLVIKPKSNIFELHLGDLWRYRDLIWLFVKRDLTINYKQTILGPIWFVVQPVIMTLIFTLVFGLFARISTDGVPPFLFYLAGNVVWAYFATCVNETSNTFVSNASIFGKVYFPRLTVPISVVIGTVVKFFVQLGLFIAVYLYFYLNGSDLKITIALLGLPLLILQMGILSLGVGILISSLVTKYRDLTLLMAFGVQIWMYATPVIYPLSMIPEKYVFLYMFNPMASILEWFKYAVFGIGSLRPEFILISWMITLLIFAIGLVMFNKIEKSFMDTV